MDNPEFCEKSKAGNCTGACRKFCKTRAIERHESCPSLRLSNNLNKRFEEILGGDHESFFHIVGTSASALMIHLAGLTWGPNDYDKLWVVGMVRAPRISELIDESSIRKFFNWNNLRAVVKDERNFKDLILPE